MQVNCSYFDNFWGQLRSLYTCNIFSASITKRNQEIKTIGKHALSKTDKDVKAVYFIDINISYMPRKIKETFPNLRVIEIYNCGLKEITREDLVGLEDIEVLNLNSNELTTLPDDLFEGMKKLNWINLTKNKLEFVSSQLLQPILENLTYASFLDNPTINAAFDASLVIPFKGYVDLPSLMKLIDEKCQKPIKINSNSVMDLPSETPMDFTSETLMEGCNNKVVDGFKNFWSSGEFSDFTVTVADRKFQVHKSFLAIQSKFFAELFTQKNLKEIQIENLCAEAVEDVLGWMYTYQTPEIEHAEEVFVLAARFKMFDLVKVAENMLISKLNKENSMENSMKLFEIGHRYGAEQLKKSAFEKIKTFTEEYLDENLMEHPEELKKIVERNDEEFQVFKKRKLN